MGETAVTPGTPSPSRNAARAKAREAHRQRMVLRDEQLERLRAEIESEGIPPEELAATEKERVRLIGALGRTEENTCSAAEMIVRRRLKEQVAARWADRERYAWDTCPSCNERWVSVHCASCHSTDHNACEECGVCLGASGVGNWAYLGNVKYGPGVETRRDRAYCSNACRQRAYRARGAA